MTGIAAIALCAAFTSCSKESAFEQMTPGDQVHEKYNQAFLKYIGGTIDPNQDWGFSATRGITRVENANANEWADPTKEYGGLLVPPPLTDQQIAVVKKYFQTHPNLGYEDPGWTNYFIQQVYKGGTSPMTGTNPVTGQPYSPEKYVAADGHTLIIGSAHMDHLAAINGSFVDHINNFNHGDCSPNGDVLDNGEHVGGKHHTDKIMYMKESTTASFGYYNSNGSVRRTEYTGLVSYTTIMREMGSEADCLDDGWNRSFMGFDFEQMIDDEIYAKNGNNFVYYTFNNKQYHYLNSNMNMYCGDLQEFNNVPNSTKITELLADGYLPVDGSADKKWVKVGGCADGYYSDWIVTLTKAEINISYPKRTSLRVMAEDLSASEASDFDFNDIVFDVYANEGGTSATIILKAAGGTLPLRINGDDNWEVHKLFGVPVNTMVNTGAAAQGLTGEDNIGDVTVTTNFPGDFSEDNFCKTVGNILIEVNKNGVWMPLTAKTGEACCKFGCDPNNKWVPELENIDGYYNFSDWVKGFTTTLTAKKTW